MDGLQLQYVILLALLDLFLFYLLLVVPMSRYGHRFHYVVLLPLGHLHRCGIFIRWFDDTSIALVYLILHGVVFGMNTLALLQLHVLVLVGLNLASR